MRSETRENSPNRPMSALFSPMGVLRLLHGICWGTAGQLSLRYPDGYPETEAITPCELPLSLFVSRQQRKVLQWSGCYVAMSTYLPGIAKYIVPPKLTRNLMNQKSSNFKFNLLLN